MSMYVVLWSSFSMFKQQETITYALYSQSNAILKTDT